MWLKMHIQLILLTFCVVKATHHHRDVHSLDGKVIHGFNRFDGQQYYDFSAISTFGDFGGNPRCGIATLSDENDVNPSTWDITAATDRSRILATCPESTDTPQQFLSIPVMNCGTLDSISTDHTDRFPILPFNQGTNIGDIRASSNVNIQPTLGDWDAMSGRLEIRCHKGTGTGPAELKFSVQNGFPKMLYTVWEIELFNPLAGAMNGERPDGVPPSLPNILITDKYGNGEVIMDIPYCPYNSCKTQSECDYYHGGQCPDCVLMYILSPHWDYSTNGGTSAWEGTAKRLPAGTITAFQMMFVPNSNVIQN